MRYWIGTTKRIDYGIKSVVSRDGDTFVTLERVGEFPMPVDLTVARKDGTTEMIYIPMNELLGKKPIEDKSIKRTDAAPWPWVNSAYTVKLPGNDITSLEIDPSQRMADINRQNNKWNLEEKTTTRD